MKSRYYTIFVVLLIIFSFLTGFTYRDIESGSGPKEIIANLKTVPHQLASMANIQITGGESDLMPVDTYCSVAAFVTSHYYGEKPESKELTYSALRGMLNSLGDRYTRFLDPEEHTSMQEDNRGDFEGIGAVLDSKDGTIFINKPIEGSPALKAGVKAGDIILKVDEKLIAGMDITDVVKIIRGEKGTPVTLTILREGKEEPIEVEIIRNVIRHPIVEWRMEDEDNKIGYLSVLQFNEKVDEQVSDALMKLEAEGAKALILDLRRNPGGLLDSAVSIGSRFIKRGNVLVIQHKGGRRSAIPVEPSRYSNDKPLVVLIESGTASASEIVAGAIQDYEVGTLIGRETFGKGKIQTIINLPGGEAVAITTAKYLTPKGRDVDNKKIQPDIEVEPSEEDIRNDVDTQLQHALNYLRDRLGSNKASVENKDNEKI